MCLLAFVAAGCSGSAPKTQITTTSEQRLVAQAEPLPGGKILLRVGREWTRERTRISFHGDGVQVAGEPVHTSHGQVGTTIYNPDGPARGFGGADIGQAAAWLLYPLVSLIQAIVSWTGGNRGDHPPESTFETVYDRTWQATIEPASGDFVLSLGAQPAGGYVLDAETVRQLGTEVVVRDRELSVAIRLPAGQ